MGSKLPAELHLCQTCGSNLVQPMDLEPRGPGRWYVELRCPNCAWGRDGIHRQAEVDRFDDELARGEAVLLAALEEVTRTNMEEETERFARALSADAILPMDF
jgi:hypothetical protein